jgi:hypothetical protein
MILKRASFSSSSKLSISFIFSRIEIFIFSSSLGFLIRSIISISKTLAIFSSVGIVGIVLPLSIIEY